MAAETTDVDIRNVKAFWEQNPVASEAIDDELGTAGFFRAFVRCARPTNASLTPFRMQFMAIPRPKD
jgi:hypothetical protein